MKLKLLYTIGFTATISPIYASTPAFVGDLVARDLSGAGPLGHVGIASAPDYRMRPTVVLEAMNSMPHIQENTIDDFKSRSKFWGSKGGLLSPQSVESFTVANRIVRQYYACPEYTITWRWREGKLAHNNKPISCGQFRCDTLVNYAYAFNKGYSLPTYDTIWTTPLAVYHYFPVDSDLLMPQQSIHQDPLTHRSTIEDSISSINENTLKNLDAASFYQMLQNSPYISEEQMKYLWTLFTENHVNHHIKILFYDFISFENPTYLTHNIIKQAKKERGELRHKLLVILQFIYQNSWEQNGTTGVDDIIDYFKELQHQDLDKNDAGIVYRGLATLAPNHLEAKKINVTNMDKIHVDILKLKNDRTHEIDYVKDMIENLEHPDDGLVVTASYQYLAQLLVHTDLSFFSNKSKQLFKEHLDHQNLANHHQSMLYTSAYIELKATLNARTTKEIPRLTHQYMQMLAPDIQEVAAHGFTDVTKNH